MDYQQQLRSHDMQRRQNRRRDRERGRIARSELRGNQQRLYNMYTELADAEIDIPPTTRPDDEQPDVANAPQEDEVLVFDASPRTPVRQHHH